MASYRVPLAGGYYFKPELVDTKPKEREMSATLCEKRLQAELKKCVSAWGDDFDIDIEQESTHRHYTYFAVIVTHEFVGPPFEFSARVSETGECQMDFTDNCEWAVVDMGNLFAAMWFYSAETRAQS